MEPNSTASIQKIWTICSDSVAVGSLDRLVYHGGVGEDQRSCDQRQPKHRGQWTAEEENRDVDGEEDRVPDVSMQAEEPQTEFVTVAVGLLHKVDNDQLYEDEEEEWYVGEDTVEEEKEGDRCVVRGKVGKVVCDSLLHVENSLGN